MTTYSQNLLLSEPTPLDPAVRSAWGAILNTDLTLLDSAIAGILPLSVAGNLDVTLTSVQGASDQARNQHFDFSGLLTGNINIFWPLSRNRFFSVKNSTTGAFTLTIAVTGTPGTTVVVPQGQRVELFSDGTNIAPRFNAVVGSFAVSSLGALSFTGAVTMSGAALNEANATIASAATTSIGAAVANYLFVSGTTTITAFDTVQAGVERTLEFQGTLTLTHNGTSLILPTQANITTASGDTAIFRSEGAGNWRCIAYEPATGNPVNIGTSGAKLGLLNANKTDSGNNTFSGTAAFSKQTTGTPQVIGPTSGAVSIDLSLGNMIDLTLNGNMTSLTFTNPVAGQSGRVNITYSGGAWTVAGLDAKFKFPNATAPTFSSTSGQRDKLTYDITSTALWDANLLKNFA